MTIFYYKSISGSGDVTVGEIEKPNEAAVVEFLRAKGHLPIVIKPKSRSRWAFGGAMKSILNSKETLSIVSGLSDLLESGVSIEDALKILAQETESSKKKRLFLQHLISEVRSGKSVSAAFVGSSMLPKNSAGPLLSLIKAGEKSGQLANNFTHATTLLRNSLDASKKLQSALSYPLVVVFIAFFTLIFMGTVIAPAFKDLFQDLGKELPATLQLLISFVDLVPLFLAIIFVAVLAVRLENSFTVKLQDWFSGALLKVPIISDAIICNEIANFSFLLANLLKGGVEIVVALNLARAGVANKIIARNLEFVSREVENGRNLSAALLKIDGVPGVFIQMVRIGEANGNLSQMLHRSAGILRNDLEEKIERLTAFLPAVLICLLGGLIGLLVSSIFGAILDINDLVI